MATPKKISHITNIRYPFADKWDKTRLYCEFELGNLHFSMVNSIRRIMISEVKTVGLRTEPHKSSQIQIKINDSPLHNQFLSHRLAMVPLHIPHPDKFNPDDYLFIIDVVNDSQNIRYITTKDIQVKHVPTNKLLSEKEVRDIFPPDPITGDFILLTILRSKYFSKLRENPEVTTAFPEKMSSKTDDVGRLLIEAKACVSNGLENGHFSPVSCAAYVNTVDPDRALKGQTDFIATQNEIAKINNTTPYPEEYLIKKFETSDKNRFYFINDRGEPILFTFKIESVGVIPPLVIFHRAITILKDKIMNFVNNLVAKTPGIIQITPSTQFNGGYDILIINEDDTLGNIVQMHLSRMYADYSLTPEQRQLTFIGYRKTHPLENKLIMTVGSDKFNNVDDIIGKVMKPGCQDIVNLLNKIQKELEDTVPFTNELKSIA